MKNKQSGFFYPVLAIPTLVFLLVASVGWNVYQNSKNKAENAPASAATPIEIDGSEESAAAAPAPSPASTTPTPKSTPTTPKPASPTPNPAPTSKYLTISQWGIKLKYTAGGSYTLNYNIFGADTLYLSTNHLDAFASTNPECSEANKGTILNRIMPGGQDYTGETWSESRLQSVSAVKVGAHYYVEFFEQVCSTDMGGVSFDTQQEYISLRQKIPFHDAVQPL